MVSKVSSLLKTVKNVEDEASKVVRSLENTIDAIDSGLEEYDSSKPAASDVTPEDLIRSTKVDIWELGGLVASAGLFFFFLNIVFCLIIFIECL